MAWPPTALPTDFVDEVTLITGAWGNSVGTAINDLVTFDPEPKLRVLRTDSTAAVALGSGDLAKTVFCTFDGAVTATVDADLPAGWWCEIIAAAADTVVTVEGDTGVTIVAAPSAVTEDRWSTFRLLRTPTANQVHVTGRGVES